MVGMLPMFLGLVIYLGFAAFMISLALRFVRASERVADSMDRIANKP